MKNQIIEIRHIMDMGNVYDFELNCKKIINDMQNKGLNVEIQYKQSSSSIALVFSALVIGRKE